MKKKLLFIPYLFITFKVFGQIGIGTSSVDPNIILQVESLPRIESTRNGGILFPRIPLTATNIFAPVTGTPVTGLIVYNTSISGSGLTAVTPGFYYWDNSALTWLRITQKSSNDTALFANQDSTTDINAGNGIYADLFANTRFNSNTVLYQKVDNTTLRVNGVGFYKVILNLDLASSGGADNFGVEIVVNNLDNIVSDNIYIPGRWDDEGGAEANFPNGRSFVIYIPINTSGSTVRVRTYEIDPSTNVQFKNPNTSTISIEKLR